MTPSPKPKRKHRHRYDQMDELKITCGGISRVPYCKCGKVKP